MLASDQINCDIVEIGNWTVSVDNEDICFKYNGNKKAYASPGINKVQQNRHNMKGVIEAKDIKTNKISLSNWKIYQNVENMNELKFDYNNDHDFIVRKSS